MDDVPAADFYTGIVVDAYAPLRGTISDPGPYAAFVRSRGEPALELGCGDGDPMLALRAAGLHVEGLDSSADMLARLRQRAAELDLDVDVHHSTMEEMDLGRRYRSIYLAGPTFNLLPDDATARRALQRIRSHLEPSGTALVPLFVPDAVPDDVLGVVREHIDGGGRILRVAATASVRDDDERRQTTSMRYEVVDGGEVRTTERPWTLHWWSQTAFRQLALESGLRTQAVLAADGSHAPPDAVQFTFLLQRDDAAARSSDTRSVS